MAPPGLLHQLADNRNQEYHNEGHDHPAQDSGIPLGLDLLLSIHLSNQRKQPPKERCYRKGQCGARKNQGLFVSRKEDHDRQQDKDELRPGDPIDQVSDEIMDLGVLL
jgi:hypothetical protein